MQSTPQLPVNESDSIIAELKRIRVCTPDEQQEFGRLGRLLLDGGVSEEELQTSLGYESVDAVRKALERRASALAPRGRGAQVLARSLDAGARRRHVLQRTCHG